MADDQKQDLPPGKEAPPNQALSIPVEQAQELSVPGGGKDIYPGIASKPFEHKVQEVLNRKFEDEDVEIRPDGIIYIPAIYFQERLNEAFGQGRWALERRTSWSDPRENNNVVMATFFLKVDGRYIAESTGGKRYYPENKDQTWDDVIEGATSTALMRCAKKVGVALECWKPRWRREWLEKYAVRVWCKSEKDNSSKPFWRRKDNPNAFGWPWRETGEAPKTATPQAKAGARKPADPPRRPAAPASAPTGGSSKSEAAVDNPTVSCSILAISRPQTSGGKTLHRFQVEDELGEAWWAVTDSDQNADLVNSAFNQGSKVELIYKEHAGGGREILGASPVIES